MVDHSSLARLCLTQILQVGEVCHIVSICSDKANKHSPLFHSPESPAMSQSEFQSENHWWDQEHYPAIYVALQDITDVNQVTTTSYTIIQTKSNIFLLLLYF